MQSTAAYTRESVTSQTAISKGILGSRPKTTKAGYCLVLAERLEFKVNSQRGKSTSQLSQQALT